MYLLTFQVACLQFSKRSLDKKLGPQRDKMYSHLQALVVSLKTCKMLRFSGPTYTTVRWEHMAIIARPSACPYMPPLHESESKGPPLYSQPDRRDAYDVEVGAVIAIPDL